jgi:CheY-like chemotaxis protein
MMRVLIVDDETSILGLLRTVLESEAFEVHTARSAAEAKSRLQQTTFDLVLTDMRMETPIAGYDVVRAARQLERSPVVVILTAFPMPPSDWRASGADALLVKGANILDLPQTLRTLLKAKPQNVAVQYSQASRRAKSG